MRILVHEFASGGGLAGRPRPRGLAREGGAMLAALLADLAALPGLDVRATVDPRTRLRGLPPSVRLHPLPPRRTLATLLELARDADAVWLIAPEAGGTLARLAAAVERTGTPLLGPDAQAIRRAADKAALARRLARADVPVPAMVALARGERGRRAALAALREITAAPAAGGRVAAGSPPRKQDRAARGAMPWLDAPSSDGRTFAGPTPRLHGNGADPPAPPFPLVVKPARGAGCAGVALVRSAAELPGALRLARRHARGRILVQPCLPGVAASVLLLGDGRRAVPLAVNAQHVRPGRPFRYDGGETPLCHPLAERAAERAAAACAAVPGLRGMVGVDLVLTADDAVVIEVNPRLTTAYLGVRATLDVNLAGLALAACRGELPEPPAQCRRVRFDTRGRVEDARAPAYPPAGPLAGSTQP